MTALQPWANCPPCPSCSLPCGTGLHGMPADMLRCSACGHEWHEADPTRGMPADMLRCSACGHEWHEADPTRVEQAARADDAWRVECARTDDVIADQLGLPRKVRR